MLTDKPGLVRNENAETLKNHTPGVITNMMIRTPPGRRADHLTTFDPEPPTWTRPPLETFLATDSRQVSGTRA
jgi:hypothetical protein